MNVAVVGASNKSDRYSYQAVMLLKAKGHVPYPVHPSLADVDGLPVYPSIAAITAPLDVLTMYLSARHQTAIEEEILHSGARRVIFNPGAENPALSRRLQDAGVETLDACTLVLLRTGQF